MNSINNGGILLIKNNVTYKTIGIGTIKIQMYDGTIRVICIMLGMS